MNEMTDANPAEVRATRRVAVLPLAEVPENGNKAVDVEGVSVLLIRSDKGVFAVENRCSHQFSPLEGGKVRGVHLFCPKHSVRFDLRTGQPAALTKVPIRTFAVTVIDGMVEIDWPL